LVACSILGVEVAKSHSDPIRVCRYDLESAPYQQLLRDYLAQRLKLDLANTAKAQLADAIICAADNRFAYVSFLSDRWEIGAASEVGTGTEVYRIWLANLERRHGRKQADAIREVLAMLAAAEEAHAWVFGTGRKIDPATGGVLTPLSEQFQGLEIEILAHLLDRDRPHAAAYDRLDPGLLFTLQTVQGVIWISRAGEGTTRFRLALKEFLPAAKADPIVGPMLPLMHARMATSAFDIAELLDAESDDASETWELFRPLAPLLEAAVHLSASETIARRWRPAELVSLLVRRVDAMWAEAYAGECVPWVTLMAAWQMRLLGQPISKLPVDERDILASTLQRRSAAKSASGDFAGAIADDNAAIGLMQAIRETMGKTWPTPFEHDNAQLLQNRGLSKMEDGDLAGGIADLDAAIEIMNTVCDAMGESWPVSFASDLATSLRNRGYAKVENDPAGAIEDFDSALELMHGIRNGMRKSWPVPFQNEFAKSMAGRASAKFISGNLAGAIADFDAAIGLMQVIRDAMGENWPIPYRSDFANSLAGRASANIGSDPTSAIADLDAAIGLMQVIRDAMGENWLISFQSNLAKSLHMRGNAKASGRNHADAIADFDAAIGLMQATRNSMGKSWPVPLQNELAGSMQDRGIAKVRGRDHAGAIADFNAAIELRLAIRDALGKNWPAVFQSDLAESLTNRGYAKAHASNHADDAIADSDAAIGLMQAMRNSMGQTWPAHFQRKLVGFLYGRALAKRMLHDAPGARADADEALVIQEHLVNALGTRCPWSDRVKLVQIRWLRRGLSTAPSFWKIIDAICKFCRG
jgi:tetratricopeptide (TPR) repeat protein